MSRYEPMPEIVGHIQLATGLAKIIGLFSLRYCRQTKLFKPDSFSIIRTHLVLVFWAMLSPIVLYFTGIAICMAYREFGQNKKHDVQDVILETSSCFQLIAGTMSAYTNHLVYCSTSEEIFNGLLNCNSITELLINKPVSPVRKSNTRVYFKVVTVVMDFAMLLNRPIYFQNIIFDPPVAVFLHKVVTTAMFLQWELIESNLTSVYAHLCEFVTVKREDLTGGDFEEMSEICSQIFRVKQASNRRYKHFIHMTFANLIRVVLLAYHSFLLIVFNGFEGALRKCSLLHLFTKTVGSSSILVIDMMMVGVISESVKWEADNFRWTVLEHACKVECTFAIKRTIDRLLLQMHVEELGSWPDRELAFKRFFKAISYIIVCLMYTMQDTLGNIVPRIEWFCNS